jgi:hypothetical protein
MKKEAKALLKKAIDALVLSIELFNRPAEAGRQDGVLVHLDHAFEMLLKAAIIHRGGKIRKRGEAQTIGYEACVNICRLEPSVKFLSNDEAITLRAINGLRDAAQHYILELSESELYIYAQAGVSLFDSVLGRVFDTSLGNYVPERVLPVSAKPPKDFITVADSELNQIRAMLQPGKRRRLEAAARLRGYAILEKSVRGESLQPSEKEMARYLSKLKGNRPWIEVFPGVASLDIEVEGEGPTITLKLAKSKGIPVKLVKEGTGENAVVAVRRVDELSYYSLGLREVAKKVNLTPPKTLSIVRHLRLQEDPEYFKVFRIGAQRHKRYSPRAVERIKEALPELDLDEVWEVYGPRRRKK